MRFCSNSPVSHTQWALSPRGSWLCCELRRLERIPPWFRIYRCPDLVPRDFSGSLILTPAKSSKTGFNSSLYLCVSCILSHLHILLKFLSWKPGHIMQSVNGMLLCRWSALSKGTLWWWKCPIPVLSNMVTTSHRWLLSTWNVADATEEVKF